MYIISLEPDIPWNKIAGVARLLKITVFPAIFGDTKSSKESVKT